MSSMNRNNVLSSDRSCVRQSSLFRQYESGNSVKGLLGTPNLCWNTHMKEGVFTGQIAYDEASRTSVKNECYTDSNTHPSSNKQSQAYAKMKSEASVSYKRTTGAQLNPSRSTRPW